MANHTGYSVHVCRTCPRGAPQQGALGAEFADGLKLEIDGQIVRLLKVDCLGACRVPLSVAIDGPAKPRLRFSAITIDDTEAFVQLVARYRESSDGSPDERTVPFSLRLRLTAVSPKRAQPRFGNQFIDALEPLTLYRTGVEIA